jgi:hypothetical protein
MSKIAMIMKWDGVTLDQYDEVRNIVQWEEHPADGGLLHVCTHDGSSLRVVDVWDSAEQFNHFVESRLMPGVMQAGIHSQPHVELLPVHALFTPAFERKLETA